ncbi:MAG: N-acyl homoserine lactonase family protein [Colwellia sp.]|nr:N-acyl homoserine lactonase family protein [Colwellia sp.]
MKKMIHLLFAGILASTSALAGATDKLKLYTIDCGVIKVSDMDVFSSSGDYAKQKATLASTCFLISHPAGNLLWDTGLPGSLINEEPAVNGVFTLSLDKTIITQLAEIDLTANDINFVSISHSHFDHVGQISSFPTATWLVNNKEKNAMFASDELKVQNAGFNGLKQKTFDGDYDVFGDGSVKILAMPGHTKGHTVLQLMLEDTGPVLISGDLYHQAKSRALKRVPRFNVDEPETRKSFDHFEKTVKELNAKVIIQHERNDVEKLPELPSFLQ